jgi:type IV pilus assembly protein PilQ
VIRVAQVSALNEEEISREAAERKKDGLVPLQTSVIPVRFAAADELRLSMGSMLSPRGKIDIDTRTNSLVVTDIPSTLPVVQGLVNELDTKTPQVEIVAQLVDLDTSVARELGIDWSLDNLHSTQYGASGAVGVNGAIASPVGTVNLGVIKKFGDLDLLLQALEQKQKANIISNPKITTVNNREASILVGQEIPLIVQDEAGNPITELKKIGITLRVTPYINQDGLITLDLHPEVSDLASQSSTQTGIIINTSEADTRVMVMDGETAVIGGLIRQNETEFESRVPILGSIPILGHLFRSKSTTKAKRELVIFVTPRIIQ